MIRSTLAGLALAAASLVAAAQDGKPIEWVVGYAAGGGSDSVARPTDETKSKSQGAPIDKHNKPGAATNIATEIVANAAPDGYTLLLIGVTGAINTTLIVVFVVLRLTHLIDWSWWWVFAPLWVTVLVVFVLGWGIMVYGMWRMSRRVKRAVRR